MEKINPQIKITELSDTVLQKVRGVTIDLAPQPKMTAPIVTIISTGSSGAFVEATNSTTLENMRTRINEIENALVRLGLINSRDI